MLKQKNFLTLVSQISPLESKLFKCRLDIEASNGPKWSLYFYLGRLVWSSGGAYPVERWQRLLNHYCPEINSFNKINLEKSQFEGYTFLYNILERDISKRSQIIALVKDTLIEVLFDILQYEHQLDYEQSTHQLSFTYDKKNYPKTVLTLAQIDETLAKATRQWQLWQNLHLTSYSPNLVPIIKHPERLRQNLQNSITQYRILTRLVDGKRTLRSLALELGQPLPSLTLSFVQYVNSGMMRFVEVEKTRTNKLDRKDEYILASSGQIEPLLTGNSLAAKFSQDSRPLIMCIDDSSTICTQIKQITTRKGCRFLGIQDPINAIPSVLKIQPNLIFLDLVMPIVNGYELCAQIRRISKAKNIPIVILTGKDGLIDRVRAKIVGSSGFLAKPVNQDQVLAILRRYDLIKPKKTRN